MNKTKKNIENSSRIRGRTQIIADILHHCKENKRKSHVMQKANLNFDQVSTLQIACRTGFLTVAKSSGLRIEVENF